MTIYNFYAINSKGKKVGFCQTDTREVSKLGMLALAYKNFPEAMRTAETLVLRYPSSLREDFPDIRLSVKQAHEELDALTKSRNTLFKESVDYLYD